MHRPLCNLKILTAVTNSLLNPITVIQTYHRGFGAGGMFPTMAPLGGFNAGAMHRRVPAAAFYDPEGGGGLGAKPQTGDPVAYRGSVLSNATNSTNHDELLQAYEYGRKQRLRSGTAGQLTLPAPLPPGNHPVPSMGYGTRMLLPGNRNLILASDPHYHQHHHTLVQQHPYHVRGLPSGAVDAEVSGGSASSDATDSGIRQFTQQPPQPDEARLAACEMPLMCDGERFCMNAYIFVWVSGMATTISSSSDTSTSIPSSSSDTDGVFQRGAAGVRQGQLGLSRLAPPNTNRTQRQLRPPPPSTAAVIERDCPSEMTDTYASVNYNGTPYGPLAGRNGVTSRWYGGVGGIPRSSLNHPTTDHLMRTRQPLPAIPG